MVHTFPHIMIKEIFENPRAVRDTALGRVDSATGRVTLEGIHLHAEDFSKIRKIRIAASGTSRHAGIAGRYMIQELACVPVYVEHASEFEYGNPITGPDELTIVITQSGETADTRGAMHLAKSRGSKILAITNVVDSTIAREADAVIYTHAGAEISIASTKAFSAQLVALFLLGVYLGDLRGTLTSEQSRHWITELLAMPDKITHTLTRDTECSALAEKFYKSEDFLFIARGVHFPIALDGALKMKETSYIHAEGYPAGEIKHGPYALIDEKLPVVAIATRDPNDAAAVRRSERTLANCKEITETGGRVIVIATEGDRKVEEVAQDVIYVPEAPELLSPLVEIVPLQLLAYHIAVRRGVDVDRPRNLVKAVTTE
ncbi:MAG TPA: isomerizing glutamine--fructose-6-phosphate transaminase [Terriglobales bacterium]|nr:isomerizing glutamine--fructose-6-phosphate transaminase [Terriglobales bacterium]